MTLPPGRDAAGRESTELLSAAAALEGHDRAVVAMAADGRVASWNSHASRVTGWSSEAARGRLLAELVHAGSRHDLNEGLELVSLGRSWTARLHLEGPGSEELVVEVSAEPVLVDDLVVGAVGVLRPLSLGGLERVARELSAVLTQVTDAVVVLDQDGRVTEWNPAAEQLLGWSRPQMLGAQIDRIVPPSDGERFQRVWTRLTAGQVVRPYEAVRLDHTGAEQVVRVHVAALREHGEFSGVIATLRPLSPREVEDRLLSDGLAKMPLLVLAYDHQAVVTLAAGGGDVGTGLVPDAIRGMALLEALPQQSALVDAVTASLSGRATQLQVLVGERVWLCHIAPMPSPEGRLGGLLSAVDVTQQRFVDRRLDALLAATPLCLISFDAEGRVTYAAGSGFDGFGVDPEDTVGQTMQELYGHDPQILQAVTSCLEGEAVDVTLQNGGRRWDVHYRAHRGPDGQVTGGICIAQHATGWNALPLLQEPDSGAEPVGADQDAADGLPGPAELRRRLGEPLLPWHERGVAVVCFEGLELLEARDDHGHVPWAQQVIAARLHRVVEPAEAFHSQDEMVALVLDAVDVRNALAVIVRDVQAAVSKPVDRPSGGKVHLAAMVGVAVSDSAPLSELLRSAEQACRQAMGDDRADVRWFVPGPQRKRVRLGLIADLRQALPRGELRVHYQPIIDLKTRQAVGAEALVRWEHPKEGLLPPSAFLGLAENTGVIHDIGTWVTRTACRTAAELATRGMPPFLVSVNVSAYQLVQDGFVEVVAELLAETGCPAGLISVEVTESALAVEMGAAAAALTGLKELGVRLALDDFGTGYSSLLYLKHFPVDTIKIDRSFVAGLGLNEEDGVIVASTVSLAHRVGVTCVAEGVETVGQLELLRKMGCDYAQGYLFSRPMPGEALPDWLHEQSPPASRRAATPAVPAGEVAEILRMHEEGASPHTIAAALNVTGRRTPRGTRWHASSVAAVVAHAAYPQLDLGQRHDQG
ncbi:MAG: domain S-box protein [Frankiales bacterium]|nr:domain S-box protein [Frankiales bacterium]